MVFNWFRRRFDNQPKESQSEPAAPEQAETPQKPEAAEQSQNTAEDYLTWAKTAYKNIQQRRPVEVEAETSPAATPEPDVTAPETKSPAVDEDQPKVVEPEATPTPEFASSEEVTGLQALESPDQLKAVESPVETVEASSPTPETTVTSGAAPTASEVTDSDSQEAVTATEAAAPESEQITGTPLPFWARAAAERQERMERLKNTAIEEPEEAVPEQTPSPGQPVTVAAESTTLDEAPELAFDEGFLWSAEILAAQGRRPDEVSISEITWLRKLRQGLDKTRRGLVNQLKAIVGQGPLNQDAVMEIEALLLQADVGVEATDYVINALQQKLKAEALPSEAAIAYLKKILRDMLDHPMGKSYNLTFAPEKDNLNVWLITGVNGAGKTTTIGKIAHIAQESDYQCLIAAADTFRAAAVEQVRIWGQRSNVEVIANPGRNADPAAVVFDAIAAAQARKANLLLVDTAGRLQNKKNLMDELSKIRRIIDKKAAGAKVESLLVLDATLGQNGLRQAQVFSETAQLTGVVLTKLDSTAKGGVALAVVQQLGLPIRFIGAGEGIEDLRPFSSYEFVEALLSG
jgi:fused signal recognition particle receptor